MDPFTISTIVVKLTATCLTTAKALYDLRQKYNDSPLSIVTISSETTVISACLFHLQTIICRKQDFVQELDSRPELAHTLDGALTGCMVLFSCLDEEVRKITASSSQTGALAWKGKAKAVWSHERLRDLLDALRGQQIAINLLIQLVQLDSLGEIKQLLSESRPVLAESIKRTQSLKQSHPDIAFPTSIYSAADRQSIYSNDPSVAGASDLEFDFDDLIVNSKVYRRVLASAKGKVLGNDQQVIEGDLIDLSESQTIIAEQVDGMNRDLECLIVSHDEQTFNISPRSPISHNINDIDQLQTSAGQEETERENVPPLDASPPRPKVNVPGLASSSFVDGESRDTNKALREKLNNPKKQVSFGEYVLGHTLHESEQSKVKLAWKVEGGVQFAVKLRKRTHIPTSLAKIYREVAILRELYHPNIVRLREVVETETLIGIILEYASGRDLHDYINNHRYLKDNAAQKFFAQLISGVRYLHMKGIVHLDLTLWNILLDRNRNIIISGFSYANTFNPEDELGEQIENNLGDPDFVKKMKLDVIQPGGFLRGDLMQERGGTPIYMAPEILLGSLLYTARKTDIWSCGVILYEMLAGHLPYKDGLQPDHVANPNGKNLLLLYEYIAATPLAFPEHVSSPARDLVRRILVVDPRRRTDMVKVARHSWLKEYDFMLGWMYGLFSGAASSSPEPSDSVTALAGEEQVSPSPARTVQVEYVSPSLLGAAEEGSIEEAF